MAPIAPSPPPASRPPDPQGAAPVRDALARAARRLQVAGVPSAVRDAEWLLLSVLQRDRAWIYAHPEELLHPQSARTYSLLLERRIAGEPVQYLTGRQEFWGLDFEVNPDVLIPRPETEHLIEVALERLGPRRHSSSLRVADVGTGSGCVAIALARELPGAHFVAIDLSPAALRTAARNAARHEVSHRIRFVQGDLLAPLQGEIAAGAPRVDLVVSNPPYIGLREAASLPREVREHEPHSALFAGETGNELYAPLLSQSAAILLPGGFVALELGHLSLDPVRSLLEGGPPWCAFAAARDLAGIPRVASAERSA